MELRKPLESSDAGYDLQLPVLGDPFVGMPDVGFFGRGVHQGRYFECTLSDFRIGPFVARRQRINPLQFTAQERLALSPIPIEVPVGFNIRLRLAESTC